MAMTRRELLAQGIRTGAGALFLGLHGREALARASTKPGVALLCAVDFYPLLHGPAQDLQGAGTNSLRLVKEALVGHNFPDVIELINPTKQEVLDSIKRLSQPDRPFLFYFLGHGSNDEEYNGTILPADAKSDGIGTNIKREELRQALITVIRDKRAPVTCFLDTCHSWAVAFDLGKGLADRRLGFPLACRQFSKDIKTRRPPVVDADSRRDILLAPPCFLTAADATQKAYVCEINGQMAGVFSHHLAAALRKASPSEVWQNIHAQTVQGCLEYSRRRPVPPQTPMITPAYLPRVLFEAPPTGSVDLDRLFNLNFPAPSVLSFHVRLLDPPLRGVLDPVSIEYDKNFDIGVQLNTDAGYLIALEKTPGNQYVLQYPLDGRVDSAAVSAGKIALPSDRNVVFFHDRPGPDTFKFFLYRNRESAVQMLELLRPTAGKGLSIAGAKNVQTRVSPGLRDDVLSADLVTASFTFDVRPQQGAF